jgi:hypothetical protein
MSDEYVPAVGDMVRKPYWADAYEPLEVIAVGRSTFLTLTIDHSDIERQWSLKDEWVQVVKPAPLTETWEIIHTWTDADGVDYAEIRRVTK